MAVDIKFMNWPITDDSKASLKLNVYGDIPKNRSKKIVMIRRGLNI